MRIRVHDGIRSINRDAWNRLSGTGQPFLRHEFLSALESSGSATPDTGWTPCHLTLESDGDLLAAMPLYEKTHSMGEFVFDWGWADAYARAGLEYYPKLVSMVPFSPVTGPRLLTAPAADAEALRGPLLEAALGLAEQRGRSSVHWLFPMHDELPRFAEHGGLQRDDVQYHWHNRGYADFDDFLATFTSKRRKAARRERRQVRGQGIRFRILDGHALDADWLDFIFHCYAMTYFERGRPPYLKREFFRRVADTLPDAVRVVAALEDSTPIAMAFCLRDAEALYGRYWGSLKAVDCLHFETCYYQGIDLCIREGLQRFEPGTQGQFKLARGFEPTPVHSAHCIAHADGREAIADFLRAERKAVASYRDELEAHLPFRKDSS